MVIKMQTYKIKSFTKITDTDLSGMIFRIISYIIMSIAGILALFPFIHVFAKSVSSAASVTSGSIRFIPIGFQLETIQYIIGETIYLRAFVNTVFVTFIGTVASMLTTILTAYPLSKPKLVGRRFVIILYIFSMVFYGGMIPAYMVVKTLGLIDSYFALILPFVIIQFNTLIIKNYFEGLPESIEESAKLDGAGYFKILFYIICPISKPVIATISMLYAVNYWNNYFHAMLYTNSPSLKTLQLYLYDMIYSSEQVTEKIISNPGTNICVGGVQSASVLLAMVPIILLYPAVQKYFVQGITIGSVKG